MSISVNTLIIMKYTEFLVIFFLGILPYTFQSQAVAREKSNILDSNVFPKDFLFGVVISAPQNEGAWNISGRGQSVSACIDPKSAQDGSNMNLVNDFYNKYKEDVRLARSIGSQMFKLTFSWSNILPNGFTNHVNEDGVQFYKNIIDEILANGMTPMVTLFQWDLPRDMQKMGGLLNPLIIDWFEQYARFVFSTFGDKVKFWTTFNDPNSLCYGDYNYEFNPYLNLTKVIDHLCGHHTVLSHTRVYRLYDREFRHSQNGKVGFNINVQWSEPMDPMSQEDVIAAEDNYQWSVNGLLNPIFNKTGDYLNILNAHAVNNTCALGCSLAIPRLTLEQIRDIHGAADFLGLTYFSYDLVRAHLSDAVTVPLYDRDVSAFVPQGFQLKDAPRMFAKMIQRINKDYHPTIYITENGFPDASLEDTAKMEYLREHLAEVLKAIKNGVDIRGYLVWSLMDSFQCQLGYLPKYGLFQVDFNNPNHTRTPRLSAKFIAHVYKTRRLEDKLDINNLPPLNTSA